MACCGTNQWKAMQGSVTVYINGKPAVRMGDKTRHCGGIGTVIEGSTNVIIGGPPGMGSSSGGGGGGGGSAAGAGAPNSGSAAPASRTAAAQSGGGGTGAGATSQTSANSAPAPLAPLEPSPLLIAARWSVDRAPLDTAVALEAMCESMAGKPARIVITDADDPKRVIATLSAACGSSTVKASWRTPSNAPPTRLAFEVSADGKTAASNVLTLIRPIQVTLVLDDEPAANVAVRLSVAPDGQQVSARADDKGVVRFEEAPIGDYTLVLEDA